MNDNGLCGAVLISNKFVLTAAHCVGSDDDFEIGISQTSLFSGNSDSGGTEYPWSRLVVHPDYNPSTVDSDIAIYELANEVPAGSLPPIRLGQSAVTQEGTDMTVIGFGDTDPGPATSVSDRLLETTVDYVNNNECARRMGESISDGMLCGYRRGEDSCQGDSGGPLFLKGDTIEDDSLIGLVSWGYDCAGDTPGVYTRISYFYDWILETMCFLDSENVPDYVDCSNVQNTGTPTVIDAGDDSNFGGFDDFFGIGNGDDNTGGNDDFWSNLFGFGDDNTDSANDDWRTTAPSSGNSFGSSFSGSFSGSASSSYYSGNDDWWGFGGDDDTNDDWWNPDDSWWNNLWYSAKSWFNGLFGGR